MRSSYHSGWSYYSLHVTMETHTHYLRGCVLNELSSSVTDNKLDMRDILWTSFNTLGSIFQGVHEGVTFLFARLH